MPPLPWKTFAPPAPEQKYTALATKLPLTRHRHIPGFVRDTLQVRRQLAAAPGLVGYSLLAQLGAKTFWTVSVWEDEEQMRAFASAEPHRSITRRVPARMGPSVFRTFAVSGADLPLDWADVRERLAEP